MAMRSKKPKKLQAFWPIIGLVMAVAFGVIAWFLADPVIGILSRSLPAFRSMTSDPQKLKIFVTIVLFVMFILLASLVIAVSAPRRGESVDEKKMAKSRAEMIKEKELTKLRRKQMNKLNKGG
jgi:type III secretory pathway component EscT